MTAKQVKAARKALTLSWRRWLRAHKMKPWVAFGDEEVSISAVADGWNCFGVDKDEVLWCAYVPAKKARTVRAFHPVPLKLAMLGSYEMVRAQR